MGASFIMIFGCACCDSVCDIVLAAAVLTMNLYRLVVFDCSFLMQLEMCCDVNLWKWTIGTGGGIHINDLLLHFICVVSRRSSGTSILSCRISLEPLSQVSVVLLQSA